jgi:hypothetical protein
VSRGFCCGRLRSDVDTVCINHNDFDEHAAQVAQISHIYAHACQLLIWFGEATKTASLAFGFADKLARAQVRDDADVELEDDSMVRDIHTDMTAPHTLPSFRSCIALGSTDWSDIDTDRNRVLHRGLAALRASASS